LIEINLRKFAFKREHEKIPYKAEPWGLILLAPTPSRIAAGNPFLIEINLRKFAFKREREKIPYKAEPWGLILLAPPLKDRRRQSVLHVFTPH
jgi:hypothetical protein